VILLPQAVLQLEVEQLLSPQSQLQTQVEQVGDPYIFCRRW